MSIPVKQELDPRTGRPFGDHGTGSQAIEWALYINRDGQVEEFLGEWFVGAAADEWPDYYEWLNEQERT
jgi:hypothetical protein